MTGDETDRRFRELMDQEFGRPGPAPGDRPADRREQFEWVDPDPDPPAEPEYTLDNVELSEADYPPSPARPPAEPLGLARWAPLAKLGAVLLTYGLVAGLVSVLVLRLPTWLTWTIPVAFLSGLVLLLTRLPWRRPPDDDGGARL